MPTALVCVIQLASRIKTELPDPARKLYDIYQCCGHTEKTPDDGQRNSPKHVEFYSKNDFEKLVHLVGFIVQNYHDARSPERQNDRFLASWGDILLKWAFCRRQVGLI